MKRLILLLTLGLGLWTWDAFGAITQSLLTSGASTGTSATTASITPVANNLIIVTVVNQVGAPTLPTVACNTCTGLTFVQAATVTFRTIASPNERMTIFRAMGSSPGAGTVTISFGATSQTAILWSVSQFAGVNTGGTNGSSAIVQAVTGSTDNSGSGLSMTLDALADYTNHATFGAFHNNGSSFTVGSGYTSIYNNACASGGCFVTEWKVPGSTTVNTTSAASQTGAIAIEIAATPTGQILLHPLISGSSTSNTTTYPTSSTTIHANRLVIASFLVARDAGTAGTTYSLASTGATWHDVANANPYHTVGSPTRVIKQFYTMVSSDQTSVITLTTNNTMDGTNYAVTEFEGVQTGGTDGSAAIVQSPIGNSGGSGAVTLTCSLSAFADATNNVAFGAFGTSQIAGITPESGFVEIHDVTFSTPSNELMTEYKIGQDTTVNATFPAADCGCQAIEIKKLVAVTMSPAIFDDED